jgi:hypothetical protein
MLSLVRQQAVQNPVSERRPQTTAPHLVPLRPLSTEELFQVHRATFREGRNHCRWPKEVIEKFLAEPVRIFGHTVR